MDDLVKRLRNDSYNYSGLRAEAADLIEDLKHDITRQMDIATEYLNRCEALERALREIAAGGNWENGKACMNIARAALENGDDWHYEGDDMNEPPLRRGE